MLETVREFAAEQLRPMPEAAAVHAAHAAQFHRLARDLARPPCWPAKEGLDLLELEYDNFRAALDWYRLENPAAGLQLANRLTAFWSARGHFSEGRQRLGELLDLVPDDSPDRVEAMNGAAWLATDQGDFAEADALLGRSIARARAENDTRRRGLGAVLPRPQQADARVTSTSGGLGRVTCAGAADRWRRRRRRRGGPVVLRAAAVVRGRGRVRLRAVRALCAAVGRT